MRAAGVACARPTGPDVAAGVAGAGRPVGASAHWSLAAVDAVLLSAVLRLGLKSSGTRVQGPARRTLWVEPASSLGLFRHTHKKKADISEVSNIAVVCL